MQHKQMKLESPARLQELNPTATLKRIGLKDRHVLVDIGAGSGIFSIPAAGITTNQVYALEISDEMLDIINQKIRTDGITNIEPIKVESSHLALGNRSADIVLMVTVLHELTNVDTMLAEVRRIMNNQARFAVIEFHKRDTPMGPPQAHRLAKEDLVERLQYSGFAVVDDFDLGDNLYCLVFEYSE